jgi:RecA/RadA recombinase
MYHYLRNTLVVIFNHAIHIKSAHSQGPKGCGKLGKISRLVDEKCRQTLRSRAEYGLKMVP